jgi:hypothetical protein
MSEVETEVEPKTFMICNLQVAEIGTAVWLIGQVDNKWQITDKDRVKGVVIKATSDYQNLRYTLEQFGEKDSSEVFLTAKAAYEAIDYMNSALAMAGTDQPSEDLAAQAHVDAILAANGLADGDDGVDDWADDEDEYDDEDDDDDDE